MDQKKCLSKLEELPRTATLCYICSILIKIECIILFVFYQPALSSNWFHILVEQDWKNQEAKWWIKLCCAEPCSAYITEAIPVHIEHFGLLWCFIRKWCGPFIATWAYHPTSWCYRNSYSCYLYVLKCVSGESVSASCRIHFPQRHV